MTTETNVAVTTEAAPQLKSTDTSTKATLEAPKPVEKTAAEPKAEPVKVNPPEGAQDDAPDADSPQAERKQRMPRWMKERLERERQVTEARTREAMLREFQEKQANPPAPQPQAERLKTLEDFDFDTGKYTDYLVDAKLKQREEAARKESEQREQAKAAESFKSRVDAFESRAGDGSWEDIVESPINTDPRFKVLTELFMGDDNDLDIAHYLSQNLKEAERIRDLPQLQRVKEIAKLAAKFEDDAPEPVSTPAPTPPVRKTTSAPPPPKTVSGAGKPSVDVNDPNLSTAERIAQWRKQGKR